MERAGIAAYQLLRERWSEAGDITVLCGAGNNGGDGYVVARLALADGMVVRVLQLGDPQKVCGDALTMLLRCRGAGGEPLPFTGLPRRTDVIVDAVLGTGLERDVSGPWAAALDAVNRHPAPVLAIDIPSGLHSDTGRILGTAIQADATISFIGLKQGLFTGQGPDCRGEVRFDALQVPAVVYSREILSARRIDWSQQATLLQPRRRSAHKGNFGHVLVLGGAPGFAGAALMAAEAALRCGAGLVSLATHPRHANLMSPVRPELMCHCVDSATDLHSLLERATVVAAGPGLGRSEWARELLERVLESDLPLVVDADALNLLAGTGRKRDNWVLTPHPGEAGRLLGVATEVIQQDRFAAVHGLRQIYGGTAVLKGAGTLVQGDSGKPPAVCSDGNPGMASGGMGDLLSGLIAGCIAHGLEPEEAAYMAVSLHGAAGDAAARAGGERGMLATDLLPWCRTLLNPEVAVC